MNLYYIPKNEIDKIEDLETLVTIFRINALYMIQNAGSGHIGSAFSSINIMVRLLCKEMQDEDVFFSSKGHDCAALYSILTGLGKIPFDKIHTFRQVGGLEGHPNINDGYSLFNTGSLGMGPSKARGIALADRLNKKNRRIYVVCGDGETQEGQFHEALANIKADKLTDRIRIYIDHNNAQIADNLHYFNPSLFAEPNITICRTKKEGPNAGIMEKSEYQAAFNKLKHQLPSDIKYKEVEIDHVEKSNKLLLAYEEYLAFFGKNKRIVVLNADLEKDCGLGKFKQQFPDRFIECGLAEQDMVSTASGLAAGGKIPIVHSFAAFLCRRANEQIYNNCTEGRKIIYVGALAGRLPCGPGPSHESLYDIELMKTMPNLEILEPSNDAEVEKALEYAVYEAEISVYIRLNCWPIIEGMRR